MRLCLATERILSLVFPSALFTAGKPKRYI